LTGIAWRPFLDGWSVCRVAGIVAGRAVVSAIRRMRRTMSAPV